MDKVISAVVVEAGRTQVIGRTDVARGSAAELLGKDRSGDLIYLGDGMAMYVDDMGELDRLPPNTIATKLFVAVRGRLTTIHGTVVIIGYDKKSRMEASAPKWVERVLQNARYMELVFS